ncbi:integrin alpha N-terminal domain-containing protein [Coccomyxa subellipsoidea C-169]|uniref:Integrin alpha N-terminal domain-containing protein n=1 Tax=Coccomyxa subellipsoidea (strain C-169) TaxID=574566 RepID=I0Z0G7_COCSC|nr:integrin alpha N-terminal domain-containing protein [Coccomyxa subellipsoidea C-169]EIE24136.1 integrin alpha N-terminal domain-containing protein [Coccomyxa subellipsoidea C-169]|eukprot:XP_005648680.1 integrin alpha N-terminal domain-containing protein [Coccomyxa subellipsoidea C-169]
MLGYNRGAGDEEIPQGLCDTNIRLKWMTEVSSSVYATPIIHDLLSDGHKDIIVPSFVHYVEVLDGVDGAKASDDSWPAFHKSFVHASPVLFDFDEDGVLDILIATYNGEILVVKDTGEVLAEKLVVPRLRVRKDWYKGLDDDPTDHSHPDVGIRPDAQDGSTVEANLTAGMRRQLLAVNESGSAPGGQSDLRAGQRRLLQAESKVDIPEEAAQTYKELFEDPHNEWNAELESDDAASYMHDMDNPGIRGLIDGDGFDSGDVADWHSKYVQHYDDHYVDDWKPPPDMSEDEMWGDEWFFEAPHEREKGFLRLDSHIMSTPAIADIDGDGQAEIVIAASYFFDPDYYDDPEHKKELGEDVDVSKYVAGGIVVFNSRTRTIKWQQHLDLSTDRTAFKAYIQASPTLADINGDGKLEIIIGTNMGFVYVLDCEGRTVEGWPLQMGAVQAQVAVADINGDGALEIVAADARGNVAAFSADGSELWERHVKSLVAQAPSLGDINGDGVLEVVFASASGAVYALSGVSGHDVAPFPFRTRGRITAPVLLVRLRDSGPALHAVVQSYDGHLYAIDGVTGCADTVDIGETAYSMVLADDMDGNGRMDLVLATMNGNVYCFETAASYHPLKAWPSQVLEHSGFVARYNWEGVYAVAASRAPRDVRGQTLAVRFQIIDKRPRSTVGGRNATGGPYNVAVRLQGVGVEEMKAGDQPVIGTTSVPCPRTRSTATVRIEMVDENKQMFVDTFALSFHMHFHRLLKWLLVAPFLACVAAVLSLQFDIDLQDALPSFNRRVSMSAP